MNELKNCSQEVILTGQMSINYYLNLTLSSIHNPNQVVNQLNLFTTTKSVQFWDNKIKFTLSSNPKMGYLNFILLVCPSKLHHYFKKLIKQVFKIQILLSKADSYQVQSQMLFLRSLRLNIHIIYVLKLHEHICIESNKFQRHCNT